MSDPALAMIEFKSIARGIIATDALVKKAPCKILSSNPICPGKYLVVFTGEVADVDESLKEGLAIGGDLVINSLFLPQVHLDVIPAITATTAIKEFGAIGVIESFSVASCVVGADLAAKASDAKLVEMRLANGLGGKAYFVITGVLADVEASIAAAKYYIASEGLLVTAEIIPSPHPDLLAKGGYW
jgi:microcompartment protein CcmL/EutN